MEGAGKVAVVPFALYYQFATAALNVKVVSLVDPVNWERYVQ